MSVLLLGALKYNSNEKKKTAIGGVQLRWL